MNASNQKKKLLFVAGLGRNGGTLLDRVLGQLSGFVSLGELRFVWVKGLKENALCNCGRRFRDCPFWSEVFNTAFGGFDAVDPDDIMKLYLSVDRTRYVPLLRRQWMPMSFRHRVDRCTGVLEDLYGAIAEVSQGQVLIDSSKFAGYGLMLSRMSDFDTYVVHLVRDSRAAAFSWRKRVLRTDLNDRKMHVRQYSLLSSSLQWMYRNLSSESLRGSAAGYLLMRYEDFARRPKLALERILHFVGEQVDSLPFLDDSTVELGLTHTQSGSRSRFASGAVSLAVDEEWREQMGVGARTLVTMATWPLLRRYGYEWR